ncbi:LysR family transcriptional regulator [Marinibactrum halimedae]|uniref:LysR family transcriptional regulator n=1 Tax=Marinibactrum halimedae TaxID=1444977 RepID=A0AA37WLJ4_9GAMM|nr:LysR family transcriptional regulator [Marinibactrum halimedae]MCD9461157.1 LysR family transcriptional regulator [Marinibactrum halimedae]GLS26044.1 LysR family transcriptional regulator [Marinibactrum halimedae]
MKSNLEDMKLFLRIVEVGSLRQVAIEYMTEASTISRRLSALEKRLGVKLIERSKVQSFPTEVGKAYYERLRHLLTQIDSLESDISDTTNTPSGLLRVSCPVDFGALYIAPWLHDLQQAYPDLKIELLLNDQMVNLVEEGIDVALRIGQLPDSAIRARHLGNMGVAIVGSKQYLETHGTPKTPQDLEKHNFVLYNWLHKPTSMTFKQGEVEKKVHMNSTFAANNVGAIMNVVKKGGGLHYAPKWFLHKEGRDHDLVEVLEDWQKPSFPLNALYIAPSTDLIPAKVRVFIDLLLKNIAHIVI